MRPASEALVMIRDAAFAVELSPREYAIAMYDLDRWRDSPERARSCAQSHGACVLDAIASLQWGIANDLISEQGRDRLIQDAYDFSRAAFRGWRVYRLMVKG